jgi:hypothetical protein
MLPFSPESFVFSSALLKRKTWSLILRDEHRQRVFEKRVLRGIFGRRRGQLIGKWRKLYNVELHNLYYPPRIIRMIKSRRIRWKRRVARMGRREMHVGFWWESLREIYH